MSLIKINPEVLIALVENRPTLWDKSFDTNASLRTAAWKDICRVLNPEFNTLPKTQQNASVRFVMKKWANIRDAWKKSVTDVKRKAYKHGARLKFLEKNLKTKKKISLSKIGSENDSDTDSDSSKNSDNTKEEEMNYTKEDRGNEESIQGENEVNTIQFMDMKPIDENCRHISFIKGLLPILNNLGVDEVLEFQMGVIQLLRDIRRRGVTVNQTSVQRYDVPSSSFEISHLKQDQEQN